MLDIETTHVTLGSFFCLFSDKINCFYLNQALSKLFRKLPSLKGTFAAPKSVVFNAFLAVGFKSSHPITRTKTRLLYAQEADFFEVYNKHLF